MAVIVGGQDPLVVVERDRALGDFEGELAIRTLIVLPAAMSFSKEGISDFLNGLGQRQGLSFDLGPVPVRDRDLDIDRWKIRCSLADIGIDALDLAFIAGSVEDDND